MRNVFIYILIILNCQLGANPKVSIITSVYNGDLFIEGFMANIVNQSIFTDCELIMINANSPGNEEVVIKKYMQKYRNIRYLRLDKDPGVYAVWNLAIRISNAEYITNANLDDRFKDDCYEKHAKALEAHSHIDLVYSNFYVTQTPNGVFGNAKNCIAREIAEFSKRAMQQPLPNNHPMWRKSMHVKYGFFNENFKHAGDFEMWLRAVKEGAQFLKIPGFYSLYYYNPDGLSTNIKKNQAIRLEEYEIYNAYKDVFNA